LHLDLTPVAPIGANCYLIGDEDAKLCALLDPGGSIDAVLEMVARSGLALREVWLTHGHYDHVGAIPALLEKYPDLPVYIHKKDLTDPGAWERQYWLPHLGDNQRTYGEGDTLHLGGLSVQVLHTPGHSPGSVTLLAERSLFTGDTLFVGSCGRCDLPGGDYPQMLSSLKRLGALEGDYRVFPGHGEGSTLDDERRYNPYLRQAMAG
jgi:glyoxylase-like metal-dependent hydrolase (beta-lactamase superfamily II)